MRELVLPWEREKEDNVDAEEMDKDETPPATHVPERGHIHGKVRALKLLKLMLTLEDLLKLSI